MRRTRQTVVVGSEFDLVISLYTRPGHGPDPRVEHLVREMPDGPLTAGESVALVRRRPPGLWTTTPSPRTSAPVSTWPSSS
ncbi:hypothetical protein [Streptomyces sp. NPDC097981]|uniref:hypothetical protein n=1 Tax=Streptomyces sp. NPDC097981 TaxID=3155428 RepID=UPI003333CA9E